MFIKFWISPVLETSQPLNAACDSDSPPLHWRRVFPSILVEFPVFQFVPIASSPVSEHQWEESGSIFAPLYSVRYLIHITQIPWSLLFSTLNSPSSHHPSSYIRYFNPLNISMALHWTPFSYVHISCTGSSDVADCPLEETGFLLCTCVYRNSVTYTLENSLPLPCVYSLIPSQVKSWKSLWKPPDEIHSLRKEKAKAMYLHWR